MKKTIFSLALGTFGLGMAEFGIMGVLTELARDAGISIPAAGNMISFYAFGVVIGAPIVALFSGKFSLKTTLLFLVAMCAFGNALFTFSTSYFWLATGRLISGFPHGAIFGVGAIILSKIAPPGKVTVAVAGMIAGMTVANLLGVPLGTWLGHQFSWRYTFFLIAVFDALVILSVLLWLPDIRDTSEIKLTEQFHFLKKGVMTAIMMLMGLGMVLGNLFSGKLSGRFSPLRIAATTDMVIVATLLLLFTFGELKTASLVMGFICCAGLFALSAPLQIVLLQNAKGGEMLGAAGGQMAFNLGSAIGAYFGGMMITLGFSWRYVTLPAAILSFSAMSALLIYGYLRARRAQANARALA